MFRPGGANPYDEIVVKTTDENLTSENWELILNLCDKVQDEGEAGARNVIAAILKRLAHRNPNVQLYSLALAESLSKNCTIDLHREIASRAFTQALEKLVTDRTTHDKVKQRALMLIAMWAAEFESDPTLGIMEDCYNNMKSKGYKFETPSEPPPPDVDDDVRRREEEELQRALEISVQDKGGRAAWNQYSLASSSGAGSSSSRPGGSVSGAAPAAGPSASPLSGAVRSNAPVEPTYPGGYVPATAASSAAAAIAAASPAASPAPVQTASSPTPTTSMTGAVVTRVRALHTFEPTEPGELAFEKGDVIKVVDRGYKDWWRGQLKGHTGIFPVNYVEPLPEPTPAELAAEAQQEAAVFLQAANVDRLLQMLRSLDPAKDNLADNEEIQELYRSSMALRPKIVKLIDKYSQKRADLVAMNESFVKARTIFDGMMEESLARHSNYYEQQRPSYMHSQPSFQPRPDSRAYSRMAQTPHQGGVPPQTYGWNPNVYDQPGYNAYPAPAAAYAQGQGQGQDGRYPPQPYGGAPGQQPPPQQQQQQPQQPPHHTQAQPQQQAPYGVGGPQPYGYAPQQQQPPQQQQQQQQPTLQRQETTEFPNPYASSPQEQHPQPQAQAQPQPEPVSQPSPEASAQYQQQQQPQQGPPYPYDPNTTYEDPNVQAWAQYYAQGGTDPTGAVYFFSVPGVTDKAEEHPLPLPGQDTNVASGSPQHESGHGGYGMYTDEPQAQQSAPDASSPEGYGPPTAAGSAPVIDTGARHQAHQPSQAQSPLGSSAFTQAIQRQQAQLHGGSLSSEGSLSLVGSASTLRANPGGADAQRQDSVSSLPSPGAYAGPGAGGAASPAGGPYYGAGMPGLQNQFAGMRVGGDSEQPGVGA